MGTLDVTEFDQLVPDEARIAIGDHDMAFLRADQATVLQFRQQLSAGRTVGDQHQAGIDPAAIGQRDDGVGDRADAAVDQLRAAPQGAVQQLFGALGRVHDGVAGHPQAAGQAGPQLRLQPV